MAQAAARPRRRAATKADRADAGDASKRQNLTIRVSKPWKEWAEGLARHRRGNLSDLIDQALVELAKRTDGFTEEAPPR